MAETKTLKCPNCAGPIVFSPGVSQIHCEYCGSVFEPEELLKLQIDENIIKEPVVEEKAPAEPQYGYNCRNCGANVWTDDTTLATYCFYCHSPVVVAPRISKGFAPDGLIPFEIGKEKVIEAFTSWSKSRMFTPRDFGSKEHLEQLNGVYLPFWLADGSANFRISGQASNSSESRMGNYITTTKDIYDLRREGLFEAKDITALANSKAAEQLVVGTKPFSKGEMQPFNVAYLQGFFAERNNIEKQEVEGAFASKIQNNATAVVASSLSSHYDTSDPLVEFTPLVLDNWRLILHPFWLLTYRQKDTTYLYCMNGVTGESFGGLPISAKRLNLATLLLGLSLLFIFLLLGYWL